MELPNDAYATCPVTPSYAGLWFRDLDSNAELFRLVCKVADATLLHDGQTVLDASAANEQVFGCAAEALIGRAVGDLLVRRPRSLASASDGPWEGASGAVTALRLDGGRAPVQVHEVPVWCHGRSVRLLAVRVVRRQKGGARGSHEEVVQRCAVAGGAPAAGVDCSTPMVLGLAHDLNGMLTSVLTALSLLEKRGMDAAVHQCAVEACRRAAGMVAELVTVSMGTASDCPLTTLGAAIRRGARLATQGTEVHVAVDVDEGLWPVYMHEARFERVVYNLVLNAVQAMGGAGAMRVAARNSYVHQPSGTGSVTGRAVRVSVTDSGPGIPSAALASIFEPYFTTKREGMGIGLSASRALVLEAGGDITVESSLGGGSTFHVYLPAGVHTEPPPPPGFEPDAHA
jgi:nitrogen-specific signal transduction histidine kinase